MVKFLSEAEKIVKPTKKVEKKELEKTVKTEKKEVKAASK